MIAIESGGDDLALRRLGKQIAGKLLNGELIEGHVRIVGVYHPVAPMPHVAAAVALVAVAVGIPREIKPLERHRFTVARRGQQAVDLLFVGVRRRVGEECVSFRGRGWQTGQIERRPAQQRQFIRFRRWLKPLFFQASQYEEIDAIARPPGVLHCRQLRTPGGLKGPMPLIFGALIDPTSEQLDLVGAQLLTGWHAFVIVLRRHAFDQFAFKRFSRNNSPHPGLRGLKRVLAGIQA